MGQAKVCRDGTYGRIPARAFPRPAFLVPYHSDFDRCRGGARRTVLLNILCALLRLRTAKAERLGSGAGSVSGAPISMLLSGGCGNEELRLVSPLPLNGWLRPAVRPARSISPHGSAAELAAYNIERTGEDDHRITMALAGFSPNEIELNVAMHRLDNTQLGSLAVAEDKARTSVFYRRPSKAFEDAIASGGIGLRVLGLRGATPYEGGVPLFVDGKLIGAVGVSGVTPPQDGQIANAGASALN
jgi:uncharacterized protein GlcG (DUF336 family)